MTGRLPKLILATLFYFVVFMLTFILNCSGGLDSALRGTKAEPGFLIFALGVNLVAIHGMWLFWRNARGSYSIARGSVGPLVFDDIFRRHPHPGILIVAGLLLSIFGSVGAHLCREILDTGWSGQIGAIVSILLATAAVLIVVTRFKRWRYFWFAFIAGGFVYGSVTAAKAPHGDKPWPDEEQGFYGKIIDQDGKPVAGATIKFEWSGPSAPKPDTAVVSSNRYGHFYVGKNQALTFTISISKPGYTWQQRGATTRFQNLSMMKSGNLLMLDAAPYAPTWSSPELYRMRKGGF